MSNFRIRLYPSSVSRSLAAIAFFIVLTSLAGQFSTYFLGYGRLYGLVALFDVDLEQNIATLFSVLLLLCATLLLAIITLLKKQQKARDVTKWAILSFWFLLMSIDEAWSLHEELTEPIRRLLGRESAGIFYFAWIIPGIVLVSVFALFFLRFLLRLPQKTRRAFLGAATLYITGTIGIEAISGSYAEVYGYETFAYNFMATVEESLEMAGIIWFIYALLKYLADYYSEVALQFEKHPQESVVETIAPGTVGRDRSNFPN